MGKKVGVLVVDDSPLCRQLICDALTRDPDIEVVGTAANGEEAIAQVAKLSPSVVTMDVDMPGMDGLTATEKIMATQPVPILVLTADPRHEAPGLTHRALSVGALALQVKPAMDAGADAWNLAREVKLLASVRVIRHLRGVKRGTEPVVAPVPAGITASPVGIVVVAASTGGPQTVHRLVSELPPDFPAPVVVVQHINAAFADSLVGWLQSATRLKVKAAKDGDLLTPGTVLVAAPGAHVIVPTRGKIALLPAQPKDANVPSATLLFQSAAKAYGRRTVAMVLTGMGTDGVDGAVAIKEAGGKVMAQSQDSCVVFGMPGAVIAKGAASHVIAGDDMAAALMKLMRGEEPGSK